MEKRIALYLYKKIGRENARGHLLVNRTLDISRLDVRLIRVYDMPKHEESNAYLAAMSNPYELELISRLEDLERHKT